MHRKIGTHEELGELLRSRRRALKMSQTDLASLTGVDQGNLSKIERGQLPATLDTYFRLMSALGIDLYAELRS
ncbi:helix-turn-helix domain-containing protein [Poseidonocella sp. HB161398]|uniref:helix-turn-helix domain-containing protein n=1 Tax=Poseidonocella sp. HB161398 TaxID=2320855 RepID=UPI0011086203|nr:helix-turn-helix transcriptional regulator [Poseidonocella sp. HB161398]